MDSLLFLLLVAVRSKESLRFQYTMEQGYDTSCGMSVVATALDRYLFPASMLFHSAAS